MSNDGAPWGPPEPGDTLVEKRAPRETVQHVYHHTPWFWPTVGKAFVFPLVVVGGFFALVMVGAILLGVLVEHLPDPDGSPALTTTTAVTTTTGG